jgi:DHA2 family multidrug resistance protein
MANRRPTPRRERDAVRSGVAIDARRPAPGVHGRSADISTATARANAALFGMVQRQATMVSFVGIFQLLGVLFVALIPLVLLMKRPKRGGPAAAAH